MKKLLAVIALIIAFPLVSHAALTPTSWLRDTVAGFLRPNITTDTLRIPSLTSCDSIDTDADGDLACGSDAGGGSSVDGSGTANELTYWVDADSLFSLTTAVYPSLTEVSYLKGVTSAIQTQLNAKAPSTAPTFATSITGSYLTASEMLITNGSKNIVSAPVATYPSLTELTYLKGVTSAIQTQLNAKQATLTNSAGLASALSDETGTSLAVFNTLPTFAGLNTGNGATGAGFMRFLEDTDNGANYIEFISPAAITSNQQCVLEDDSSPIPDSCVGDGTDGGGGDVTKVGTPVNNQIGVWTGDGTLEGDTALTFDTTTDTLSTVDASLSNDLLLADGSIINWDGGNATITHAFAGGNIMTFAGMSGITSTADVTVPDEVYGVGWNGSLEVPTKNALYDKIETISGGSFDSTTVDATTWSDGANASNAWTFDVSGTDTTWTMGSNNWIFGTGSIDLGAAGVRLSHDADGALTWLGLGDGSDEAITYNLDDVSNTIGLSSSTGLDKWNFGAIRPQFDDLNFLADANGNELLILDTTASAVNEVTLKNNATGNNPGLTATGDDTNVGITMTMKGTGNLVFSSSSTGYIQLISNATARSWRTGGIYDSPGNVILGTTSAASAVNYVNVVNAGTTAAPTLSALGSDTNIDLALASKGTGNVTANGDPVLYRCEKLGLDPYSNITTGTNKDSFVMPYAMTVTAVYASLTSAPTGSVATFDINEDTDREAGGASATSILSTKITIDATETSSQSAATPPVISDTALAKGSTISYDHDGVGSTLPGNGPIVEVCGVINP